MYGALSKKVKYYSSTNSFVPTGKALNHIIILMLCTFPVFLNFLISLFILDLRLQYNNDHIELSWYPVSPLNASMYCNCFWTNFGTFELGESKSKNVFIVSVTLQWNMEITETGYNRFFKFAFYIHHKCEARNSEALFLSKVFFSFCTMNWKQPNLSKHNQDKDTNSQKQKATVDGGWAWLVAFCSCFGVSIATSLISLMGILYTAMLDELPYDFTSLTVIGSTHTALAAAGGL